MNHQVALYKSGEIEIEVSVDNETVWLNRQQLSELFDRDVKTVGKHITNIFREKELERSAVVAKFATTASDGKVYNVEYYNLDVIISVGYRVKSQKGVLFRQWATRLLKDYIYHGYTINGDKITNERFVSLENDVFQLKEKVGNLSTLLEDASVRQPTQGIFYNGQVFDAYVFIAKLIKSSKTSIKLIDNYIDESALTLFSKNQNIQVTLYTSHISKQLKLDLKKYNAQYRPIEVKKLDVSHDRFLIIDDVEIYHIGASLKDLGKKWFAFSRMDGESFGILERLK